MHVFSWMVDLGIDIHWECLAGDVNGGNQEFVPVVPLVSIDGLDDLFRAFFRMVEKNPLISNDHYGGFRCYDARENPVLPAIPDDVQSSILVQLIQKSTFGQVYSPYFKEVATTNGVKIPFKSIDALTLVRGSNDPHFEKNLTKVRTQFQSLEASLNSVISAPTMKKHFPLRLEFRMSMDDAITTLQQIFINSTVQEVVDLKHVLHRNSIRIPTDLLSTFLRQRLGGLCMAIVSGASRPMLTIDDYATRLQIPVLIISCRTLLSSINASQMDRSLQKWWNQGDGEHESAKLCMQSYNAVYITNRYFIYGAINYSGLMLLTSFIVF